MNRIFTSLFVLISILSSQYANAQVALSTDCSSQYLVRACQQVHNGHDEGYVSFSYDKDRHLTSLTQGEGAQAATIDVRWTSTSIIYNYGGYDMVSAVLDDKGNAKSMTNIYGENVTYYYENGYLISYESKTESGNGSGHIKWENGNPVEVKHITNDGTLTYTFKYSETPNNTNLDFGILQSWDVATFALPLGKGVRNLPIHTEEYYGENVSEIADITYEFDSQNRPVRAVTAGTDYEENRNKDFTNILTISYDESFVPLSIAIPVVESGDDSQTYNIMGQKVNGQQKGIVIRGGKKYIIK